MITTIFQVVTVLHQGEASSGKRRENWVESCGKTFTFFLFNLQNIDSINLRLCTLELLVVAWTLQWGCRWWLASRKRRCGAQEVEHESYTAQNAGRYQSNGSQKLGAGGAIERKKFPEEPGDLQNAYKVSIITFSYRYSLIIFGSLDTIQSKSCVWSQLWWVGLLIWQSWIGLNVNCPAFLF